MKTYIHSIFALAIAACAFIACGDDVDRPDNYNENIGVMTFEAQGSGTESDPFNVAGLAAKLNGITSTTAETYYVHGYVCSISTTKDNFDPSYGNINYYISDDPEGRSSWFYVYRGLGLENSKFTKVSDLKVGDEVVICGKGGTYNGATQLAQGNYLVSQNGMTTVPDDGTLGTAENPLTVEQALALINSYADNGTSPRHAYVKGVVVEVSFYNTTYKSLSYVLGDDATGSTGKLEVYSGKGLNGADFSSKTDLTVGQTVVVKGELKKYLKSGTVVPEINQGSTIVKID